MGNLVVVGGILPALGNGGAQVVVRCSHLPHDSLQVVGLHTVVLGKRVMSSKTTFPISPGIRTRNQRAELQQEAGLCFYVPLLTLLLNKHS